MKDITADTFTEVINTRAASDVLYYLAQSYKNEGHRAKKGTNREAYCNEVHKIIISCSNRIVELEKEFIPNLEGTVRRTWYVQDTKNFDSDTDIYLCKGSRTKCLSFYRRNGGERRGLHLFYIV